MSLLNPNAMGPWVEPTLELRRKLPLVSLIGKLFELRCRLEFKSEVCLIMRHYVITREKTVK